MSDQSSTAPPLLTAKPKSRWRWLKVVGGVLIGGVLVLKLIGASSDSVRFEAKMFRDGSVSVTNTGNGPVSVSDIVVNDRRDCHNKYAQPQLLKIGDQVAVYSFCNIVRIEIVTDQGTANIAFSK